MRKLIGKFILWALGIEEIQRIALEPGDTLMVVKPWWLHHTQAKELAHDLGEQLGCEIIVLPDGATLANLKAHKRVVEDENVGS